jgi:hypothetical protein
MLYRVGQTINTGHPRYALTRPPEWRHSSEPAYCAPRADSQYLLRTPDRSLRDALPHGAGVTREKVSEITRH